MPNERTSLWRVMLQDAGETLFRRTPRELAFWLSSERTWAERQREAVCAFVAIAVAALPIVAWTVRSPVIVGLGAASTFQTRPSGVRTDLDSILFPLHASRAQWPSSDPAAG